MKDAKEIFLSALLIVLLLFGITFPFVVVGINGIRSEIKSGKIIILENSSYKCELINSLTKEMKK